MFYSFPSHPWGKATALVEERVKSTLQGLEAMIKASEAQDAGAAACCGGGEDFRDLTNKYYMNL